MVICRILFFTIWHACISSNYISLYFYHWYSITDNHHVWWWWWWGGWGARVYNTHPQGGQQHVERVENFNICFFHIRCYVHRSLYYWFSRRIRVRVFIFPFYDISTVFSCSINLESENSTSTYVRITMFSLSRSIHIFGSRNFYVEAILYEFSRNNATYAKSDSTLLRIERHRIWKKVK